MRAIGTMRPQLTRFADSEINPFSAPSEQRNMNTRPLEFGNQSLSIGRRISERREFLDFPEIVRGMKRELRCLLRENIHLRIVAKQAAGGRARVTAVRSRI